MSSDPVESPGQPHLLPSLLHAATWEENGDAGSQMGVGVAMVCSSGQRCSSLLVFGRHSQMTLSENKLPQEIVVYSPFKLAIDWGFISHYIPFIPSISQICPFYIIIPPIFTAYILHSSTKHILVYIYIYIDYLSYILIYDHMIYIYIE